MSIGGVHSFIVTGNGKSLCFAVNHNREAGFERRVVESLRTLGGDVATEGMFVAMLTSSSIRFFVIRGARCINVVTDQRINEFSTGIDRIVQVNTDVVTLININDCRTMPLVRASWLSECVDMQRSLHCALTSRATLRTVVARQTPECCTLIAYETDGCALEECVREIASQYGLSSVMLFHSDSGIVSIGRGGVASVQLQQTLDFTPTDDNVATIDVSVVNGYIVHMCRSARRYTEVKPMLMEHQALLRRRLNDGRFMVQCL